MKKVEMVIHINLSDTGIRQMHIFFYSLQPNMTNQPYILVIEGVYLYGRHL